MRPKSVGEKILFIISSVNNIKSLKMIIVHLMGIELKKIDGADIIKVAVAGTQ